MATFSGRTGQGVYPDVVDRVLRRGHLRAPRGEKTRDIGYSLIDLETPYHALPLGCGRELNRNIAAAEAIQLIGGFSFPDLLTKATSAFTRYTESDGTFHGAYGKRIGYQVSLAVAKLKQDGDTRQAVVTLWDPWLDNLEGKRDYPCTVALQFEIIDGLLCMNTIMRSNDVWLGLPYDLFQFTQLQITVANALTLAPGRYRHTTWSLHLYERDVEAAGKLHGATDFTAQPIGIGIPGQSFTTIMKRARAVTVNVQQIDETNSERWYRERFASYMG